LFIKATFIGIDFVFYVPSKPPASPSNMFYCPSVSTIPLLFLQRVFRRFPLNIKRCN